MTVESQDLSLDTRCSAGELWRKSPRLTSKMGRDIRLKRTYGLIAPGNAGSCVGDPALGNVVGHVEAIHSSNPNEWLDNSYPTTHWGLGAR